MWQAQILSKSRDFSGISVKVLFTDGQITLDNGKVLGEPGKHQFEISMFVDKGGNADSLAVTIQSILDGLATLDTIEPTIVEGTVFTQK